MMATKWICVKCGSATETYTNKQGEWFSCSNEDCANYGKMRREYDGDFRAYYTEEM